MTEQGQTWVEFLVCLVAAWLALLTGGQLIYRHWNQSWCAYLTFEEVYSHLIGSSAKNRLDVRVEDRGSTFYGVGHCKKERAEVELPKLESAHW